MGRTPRGDLGEDGRFGDYPDLTRYFTEVERSALIVRQAGHPVGFVLLDRESHSGRPLDNNVGEFFIVRKHRREGLGSRVATAIFDARPGVWEAAVARRNLGALAFWRGAVGGNPRTSDLEEVDRADPVWDGPILRFRIT